MSLSSLLSRLSGGSVPTIDHDAFAQAVASKSSAIVDVREPHEYAAGHIPGALSAPAADNLTADGRLLPASQLRARFARLGACAPAAGNGHAPAVGAYCGSGVTAAHEVLALELAGIPAALYVGSWSGWVADPGRPVATGPDRG